MSTQETEREGSWFSRFMASSAGRLARVAFGATLILLGAYIIPRPVGIGVALFGLIPIAAGMFNLCPIAPVWGGHFIGAKYCPAKATKPKP